MLNYDWKYLVHHSPFTIHEPSRRPHTEINQRHCRTCQCRIFFQYQVLCGGYLLCGYDIDGDGGRFVSDLSDVFYCDCHRDRNRPGDHGVDSQCQLNAKGDTKTFRNVLIAGFILNLGLDPWLMFGGLGIPAMGIRGVAVATVIIQALGCIYLYRSLIKASICQSIFCRHLIPDLGPSGRSPPRLFQRQSI